MEWMHMVMGTIMMLKHVREMTIWTALFDKICNAHLISVSLNGDISNSIDSFDKISGGTILTKKSSRSGGTVGGGSGSGQEGEGSEELHVSSDF
jgi:uncharacterized membrane protein